MSLIKQYAAARHVDALLVTRGPSAGPSRDLLPGVEPVVYGEPIHAVAGSIVARYRRDSLSGYLAHEDLAVLLNLGRLSLPGRCGRLAAFSLCRLRSASLFRRGLFRLWLARGRLVLGIDFATGLQPMLLVGAVGPAFTLPDFMRALADTFISVAGHGLLH